MTNPEQLIGYAKVRGIALSITPDFDLKITAKMGALTPKVVNYLKQCKEQVVDKLCDYEFQNEVFRVYPDDVPFVVKQVRYVSGRKRLEIVRSYLGEFDAGYKAEANPVKKRNAGRQRANDWIREEKFNYSTITEEKCNE